MAKRRLAVVADVWARSSDEVLDCVAEGALLPVSLCARVCRVSVATVRSWLARRQVRRFWLLGQQFASVAEVRRLASRMDADKGRGGVL